MSSSAASYCLTWHSKISDIPQADWDRLALPLKTPFLEWSWLHNLEVSGSAVPKTGWLPKHLALWRKHPDPLQGRILVAAAPLYLKSHSYGEFVFDQEWAEVSYQMGVNYYPKLLGMTPFTPAEGYQFLMDPAEPAAEMMGAMVGAIDDFCAHNRIQGCHFLFVDPGWQQQMEPLGFIPWLHHSYVWNNQNYGTFESYLGDFNANQRRNIKRERKALAKAGLHLEVLTGEEIPAEFYDRMHHFYDDTCSKFMWGSKYLTRQFFLNLASSFADRVVLISAVHQDAPHTPVGMSFCLRKGDRFYGRYWGSVKEIDCLHFNACYYKPIEWAIDQGIQQFDPGAGGRHKKRRGFPATPNTSLHRFYHPKLRRVFEQYIPEINRMEQRQIAAINQNLPFRFETQPGI
ncbi:GNAT family N-acetyltransferase [Lyngbya confervoides]|uniref:GNAT family N-acetyltransferase n=1 Tax=Lyngbya confervoides BDU141951 TaxID=1574623 RepID=A0ABD4T8T7_9CYAN|nr:GNAT family N-acetyltransferase [Lyngbya confervoides]MCM1985021.1 GNAT family N-acetyltransferase [Lyngbya confervoides BDU141951]